MATEVAKSRVTHAQVLAGMSQLTSRQLEAVMAQAARIRLQKRKRILAPRESDLLRIINRGLTPKKQVRLQQLQQKLSEETITPRQHKQLLSLADELERLGAQRLRALMDLAAIRNTTVPKLVQEMGLALSDHV